MQKIVINGTFDILHTGHLRMMKYAKTLGDYLMICIDTDRRVKELKGADRPIHNQYERAEFLSSLRVVDEVRFFDSDEELCTIFKNYQPDIMVKGSDYQGKPIVGSEHCKKIIFFERLDGYSTTNTIQRIANR
jgi:D-beta-D-heptose 7-phosphate kinase/D-beta-D-heptose 1-phosphate adenosyltransferase